MGCLKLSYHNNTKGSRTFSENFLKVVYKKNECAKKIRLNYYPYGSLLPGRHGQGGNYRYGYQGSEKDDEVKGEGNSYTTKFRQLDTRIGRWLSIDPKYDHSMSPYNSMDNNPIAYNDPFGLYTKRRAERRQAKAKAKGYDVGEVRQVKEGKKGWGFSMSLKDNKGGEWTAHKTKGRIYRNHNKFKATVKYSNLGYEARKLNPGLKIVEGYFPFTNLPNGPTIGKMSPKKPKQTKKKQKYKPFAIKAGFSWAWGGGFGLSLSLVRDSDGNWGLFDSRSGNLGVEGSVFLGVELISSKAKDGFKLDHYSGMSNGGGGSIGIFGFEHSATLEKGHDNYERLIPLRSPDGENPYESFSLLIGPGGGGSGGTTETKRLGDDWE